MTPRWLARVPLVATAAVAAVLRLLHLGFMAARDPLFVHPVVDARYHATEALLMLEHGWLLPGGGAFYKGPLYSYVLAVLFAVFGEKAGVVAGRLLSVVLGTLTVALVAALAGRLGGRRAAWGAGLVAAVYGTSIYFDTTLLLVPVVAVLLLAAGERLLTAYGRTRPELILAAAGACLGLVSITRPNGLLAVALAAVWVALAARHAPWKGLPGWRAALLVLVPAGLLVAPVTARNAVLEQDPVLISWNGGINLFMGNDPAFDQGSGNWHPDFAWMRLYEAPGQLGGDRGADHQRFFLAQSLRRAAEHPGELAGILARKAGLLFSAYEIPNNRRLGPARERSPVLRVLMADGGRFALPWSLFAPLIAAGLVLAWGGRALRRGAPLVWLSVAWALTPVLFFNTSRYRLPALLLLVPVAAAGWVRLPQGRLGAWRKAGAALAAVVVLVAGAVAYPAGSALPLSDEIHLADLAEDAGDDALARQWLERALEKEPLDPFARIRLADHYRTRRMCEQALPHYRELTARDDLASDWWLAAARSEARCLAALRHDEAAIARYQEFFAAEPDRPMTGDRRDFHLLGTPPLQECAHRIELAVAYQQAGRRAEAVAELTRITVDCMEAGPIAAEARRRLAEFPPAAEAGAGER